MWEKEKHGGRVDLRASLYYLVCVHTVCMGLACVCVGLRVSRQQRSEAETDVKQTTLGLHVFTAV